MAEYVYPPVIRLALGGFRALDIRFDIAGADHVPRSGGAVLASNHVSYLDFLFCGLAARPSRRLVRFMAKESVFRHRVSGPLMRGMRHIPVDRSAGAASFAAAEAALRRGEVVGMFPEGTVSRTFELADFKSGAARLALATGVPLIPMVTWGGQQLWTKDRPRHLTKRHVPVFLRVGEPIAADGEPAAVTAELRARVGELLREVRSEYPVTLGEQSEPTSHSGE